MNVKKNIRNKKMELLKSYKIDDILNKKIGIEISVADFLSMYIAKMVCMPS